MRDETKRDDVAQLTRVQESQNWLSDARQSEAARHRLADCAIRS